MTVDYFKVTHAVFPVALDIVYLFEKINTSIYITCIFINKKEIKCYVLLGSSCMFLIINILLLYRSLEIKKTFKFNSDVHMKNMA